MYIRGEWALRRCQLNQVSGVPAGVLRGDFMRYSYLYPYIFESRTHTFSKAHALSYTHSKVGNDQMPIREK